MTDAPTDQERLGALIDIWLSSATDTIALLRSLEPAEWELPTDLPGWDVRAVAAHLAHLESELAGNPQEPVEVPEAPHIRGLMGQYTEMGPLARASWPTERIVDELASSVETRRAALAAEPPQDAAAPGPGFAGAIGWSWETLLSNRPLDLWMHEQDIRRATDRPGDLDTPGARHTAAVFAKSLPFVLGKKAQASPGATLVLRVTGPNAREYAAVVGEDGRGRLLDEVPSDPTTRITIDFESWIVLAGGRRGRADVEAVVEGDHELGARVLDNLAVTP